MKKLDRLEMEIDLRMLTIWQECWKDDCLDEVSEFVAALMRAAYGKGYYDALREPVRGTLCLDTGYPIPERGEA